MCRKYLSNYIGYTIDGTICLKTVTWSTPYLCHLFLVKSNCVISKENSGIISYLFPTYNKLDNAREAGIQCLRTRKRLIQGSRFLQFRSIRNKVWLIKDRKSAKINKHEKPITSSFQAQIMICLLQYLNDIMSNPRELFCERGVFLMHPMWFP